MLIYVLICLSLSLAGVAGLQFFYMVYLDRISSEQKKRIRELERHSIRIAKRLKAAENQISNQEEFIQSVYDGLEPEDEEVWADLIDEQ